MGRALTAKRQRFAEVFAGNGTEAAREAGFEGNDATLAVTATRLLKDAKVMEIIQARRSKENASGIATRQDRQKFWSEFMKSDALTPLERMKASELLGRSEADFTDKVQADVAMKVSISISGIIPKGKP